MHLHIVPVKNAIFSNHSPEQVILNKVAIIQAAALPSTEGEQWNVQSDKGRFALTEIHRLIPNFHLRIMKPMSFTSWQKEPLTPH